MRQVYKFLLVSIIFLVLICSGDIFSASPRRIVLEEGTNASCGPCASQNPTLKAWLEKHTDIIPVVYHSWWPGPNDPMWLYNIPMNRSRIHYYGIDTVGVPCARINGWTHPITNNSYAGCPSDTNGLNQFVKGVPATSPISLTIKFTNNGATGNVAVDIQSDEDLVSKKLYVFIVEKTHHYDNAGSNGEKDFENLARVMLPDTDGTNLNQLAGVKKSYSFDYTLDASINYDVTAVAYVQDFDTREILQSESSFKPAQFNFSALTSESTFGVTSGQVITKSYKIISNYPSDVQFSNEFKTNAGVPADWNIAFGEGNTFTVPAGATKTIDLVVTVGNTQGYAEIIPSLINKTDPSISFTAAPVNIISKDIKTLMVLNCDTSYSVKPLVTMFRSESDYAEVSKDVLAGVKSSLTGLKNVIWNAGPTGRLTSAEANAISDVYSSGVNFMLIGSNLAADLSSAYVLTQFGVSVLGTMVEGSSAPFNFDLIGTTNDNISGFIKTKTTCLNKSSGGIPVFRVQDMSTVTSILHFANDGQYTNNYGVTLNCKGTDAICGIKVNQTTRRSVFFTFPLQSINDDNLRSTLFSKSLDWLELGYVPTPVLPVEPPDQTFRVMPNIADDNILVMFGSTLFPDGICDLNISDVSGSIVMELGKAQVHGDNYYNNFCVSSLSSGYYLLTGNNGNIKYTLPFIISR